MDYERNHVFESLLFVGLCRDADSRLKAMSREVRESLGAECTVVRPPGAPKAIGMHSSTVAIQPRRLGTGGIIIRNAHCDEGSRQVWFAN